MNDVTSRNDDTHNSTPSTIAPHRPYEDVQALVTGTLFVALGVVLFGQAGLLTGGTAGLAFLIRYATGLDFGIAFFLVNLPFYVFAWRRMGATFALKTFAAVSLLSLFAFFLPFGIKLSYLSSVLAAVLGGLLCGAGMLMLFRHKASLGGLNVVVLYLQDKYGWRAGTVQMVFDCLIVLGALLIADWQRVALSVMGAVVMNLTLTINHRAGRYMAV
ncbi:MAG TPA: YitT family protein [Burkholderiaceae bacterium]|nr:YitT family protein [Burkholderiaceae bacterium]